MAGAAQRRARLGVPDRPWRSQENLESESTGKTGALQPGVVGRAANPTAELESTPENDRGHVASYPDHA